MVITPLSKSRNFKISKKKVKWQSEEIKYKKKKWIFELISDLTLS